MAASTFGLWRHLAERLNTFRRMESGAAAPLRRALLRLEPLEDRSLPSATPFLAATAVLADSARISYLDDTAAVEPEVKMVCGECFLNPEEEVLDYGAAGEEAALETETADDGGGFADDGASETDFWVNLDENTDPSLFDYGGDFSYSDVICCGFLNPADVERTLEADGISFGDTGEEMPPDIGIPGEYEVFMYEGTGETADFLDDGSGTAAYPIKYSLFTQSGEVVDNFESPLESQDDAGSSIGDLSFYSMSAPPADLVVPTSAVTVPIASQQDPTSLDNGSSSLSIALDSLGKAAALPETPQTPAPETVHAASLAQPAAATDVEGNQKNGEKAETSPSHSEHDIEKGDHVDSLFSAVDQPF